MLNTCEVFLVQLNYYRPETMKYKFLLNAFVQFYVVYLTYDNEETLKRQFQTELDRNFASIELSGSVSNRRFDWSLLTVIVVLANKRRAFIVFIQ